MAAARWVPIFVVISDLSLIFSVSKEYNGLAVYGTVGVYGRAPVGIQYIQGSVARNSDFAVCNFGTVAVHCTVATPKHPRSTVVLAHSTSVVIQLLRTEQNPRTYRYGYGAVR